MSLPTIHIVGAGLAGSEAAFFLASYGVPVVLYDLKPKMRTAAQKTPFFAELVCSNSLKSLAPHSASFALKSEMKQLGSLILRTAEKTAIPGGQALTVDRDLFAKTITDTLKAHALIQIKNQSIQRPPKNGISILATGPLTDALLFKWLEQTTSKEGLYIYDAIAPIVDTNTLDVSKAFFQNRYEKGQEVAYLNCPLEQETYLKLVQALLKSEKLLPRSFEQEKYFHRCQPIETLAERGIDTLRFGPMRPVGLKDPKTGNTPYAVVQLRAENASKTAFNLVGFQTRLKYSAQKEIFRLIPALSHATFLRYGSIHRNTFLCPPQVLRPNFSLKDHPTIYIAGQLSGVEGYIESAASGLLTALFVLQKLFHAPPSPPPPNTAMGALLRKLFSQKPNRYQPVQMQFGIFEPAFFRIKKGLKKEDFRANLVQQCSQNFQTWWRNHETILEKHRRHLSTC